MPAETLRVRGYRELVRAANHAERSTRLETRAALRTVGQIVRADAQRRFARYDARSAQGFRVRVRVGGVFVEQSLRKTTGLRPDYGALQMRRGLLPALASKQKDIERGMEVALVRIADAFDK